jgi:hypothetical protein
MLDYDFDTTKHLLLCFSFPTRCSRSSLDYRWNFGFSGVY